MYLFPSQGSDDESYVSDVSDNISEDNASVTDNVSRQSRSNSAPSRATVVCTRTKGHEKLIKEGEIPLSPSAVLLLQ